MRLPVARALWEAGRTHLDGSEKEVDLSLVREVDSSALTVLLEWQRENREKQRAVSKDLTAAPDGKSDLIFLNPPPDLMTLAELYDLDGILNFQSGHAQESAFSAGGI
jgi:ABC-type transporter Mla MlaB component